MRPALRALLLMIPVLCAPAAARADTDYDFAITDGSGNVFSFSLPTDPNGYANPYPATAYYDGGSQPIPVYENGQLLTFQPVSSNGVGLTSYPYSTGVNALTVSYGPNEEFYDPYLISLTFSQPIATLSAATPTADGSVTFFPGIYPSVYGPDVLAITEGGGQPAITPEPSTYLLVGTGLAASIALRRRRSVT